MKIKQESGGSGRKNQPFGGCGVARATRWPITGQGPSPYIYNQFRSSFSTWLPRIRLFMIAISGARERRTFFRSRGMRRLSLADIKMRGQAGGWNWKRGGSSVIADTVLFYWWKTKEIRLNEERKHGGTGFGCDDRWPHIMRGGADIHFYDVKIWFSVSFYFPAWLIIKLPCKQTN